MIESLVTGQLREPSGPMLLHVAMHGLLLELPWQMSEQVDRDQFLIGQQGFGRVIAPALIFQPRVLIIHRANPQKELNELSFYLHEPNFTTSVGFAPLPLIRIVVNDTQITV